MFFFSIFLAGFALGRKRVSRVFRLPVINPALGRYVVRLLRGRERVKQNDSYVYTHRAQYAKTSRPTSNGTTTTITTTIMWNSALPPSTDRVRRAPGPREEGRSIRAWRGTHGKYVPPRLTAMGPWYESCGVAEVSHTVGNRETLAKPWSLSDKTRRRLLQVPRPERVVARQRCIGMVVFRGRVYHTNEWAYQRFGPFCHAVDTF